MLDGLVVPGRESEPRQDFIAARSAPRRRRSQMKVNVSTNRERRSPVPGSTDPRQGRNVGKNYFRAVLLAAAAGVPTDDAAPLPCAPG